MKKPKPGPKRTTAKAKKTSGFRAMGALLIVLILAGCATHDTKYRVSVDKKLVCVRAADLGISQAVFDHVGTTFMEPAPTGDLLPSAICVVRVAAFAEDAGPQHLLRVTEMPPHHGVYWNHLFDELSAIREVIFLDKPGLDPRGYDWRDLLGAAARLEAEICMIYARLEATDADAEYVGALWNTRTFEPLAVFRTPVVLPIDLEKKTEEKPARDISLKEADFRAEQDLRRTVRDAVWDLSKRDGRAPTTQPSPWNADVPLFPRDYDRYRDPRPSRYRR